MAARTFDRSPWRLEPDVSFLNHGSFGACPEPVLEAQRAWRDRLEREPVRFLDRELEGHLDAARSDVAAFLGADPEGLAFVPNTTTGVSTVLASRRFGPGDELLACDHEYNATLNALRAAAARDGATVVIVRVPFPVRDPSEIVEAFLEAVTPRTRLAMVSHVTSPTALVMPVAALVRELDRRGVDTLVDGAHAPGMLPVDLDGPGGGLLDGQRAQVAVCPEGLGRPPRPRRPPGRDPAAGRLARRQHRPHRSLALPPRLRLDRHRRSHAVPRDARGDPVRRRAPRGRLVRAHGGERGARPRAAGTGCARPWASPRPRRTRCSARWQRCRCRTLRRPRHRGAAAAGRPVRRGPDRGPGARLPGPGGSRGRRRPCAGARPDLRPALQPAGGIRLARGAARRAGRALARRGRC